MENQKLRPSAAADSPAANPSSLDCSRAAARVYRIQRQHDGQVKCAVFFDARGAYLLRTDPRHSILGFECGYAGDGPSELAYSILADFFFWSISPVSAEAGLWRGTATENARAEALRRAEELHQDFKRAFITPLSLLIGESKDIAAAEIAQWVAGRSAQADLPLPPAPPAPRHVDLG